MTSDATPTKSGHIEIACQSCGAQLLVESHMLTAICPYCASSSIIQRPPSKNLPTPSFTIGFVIDHGRATELVQQWLRKSHLFARSDFKRAAPELTRGVYLPAYLYGAVADSQYSVSIGENYTEIETYTTHRRQWANGDADADSDQDRMAAASGATLLLCRRRGRDGLARR